MLTIASGSLVYAQGYTQVADAGTKTENIESVIVTGTRFSGVTAADSAAPVTVVGSDALSHVGQPDLIQALNENLPSFNVEGQGYDLSALTLSARLRGLSPNDTLVLVNGKRRHITDNIHADGAEFGAFQGADSADLNFIPVSAIDHIEVLQDGAAAQYGSDAIAGVINIILKNSDGGGSASATAGQYYKGDGDTLSAAGNIGFKIFAKGFLNLTVESRYHDFSRTGGLDARFFNTDGTVKSGIGFDPTRFPGYPYLNHWSGDAEYNLTNTSYNAGYDFGGIELYSFGTYGVRTGQSIENYRAPTKVVYGATELYPQGFSPREAIDERDFASTIGVRGSLADWAWDLSSTYGKDYDDIRTVRSANAALYAATGHTPTDFYDGAFVASQWTTNLDVNRSFDVGLAAPLGVAFGGEIREDTYQIKAGEPDSYYSGGAQSFPGFTPTDAGAHSRKNYATYIDVSIVPVENLKVDAAGRYEHFSDFGDTTIGKVTARYDFSPDFAVRGTISNGFRAPTLAEEYFSATNVGPSWATVVLPPNSAAAALLGISPLKPEKSTQFSAGLVAHLLDALTATLDGYSIVLGNRIVSTGNLYGRGGAVNSAAVNAAITAHGNDVSSPDFTTVDVNIFTNGISTRTRGLDLALEYRSDFAEWGNVDWTLDANYNETVITKVAATPSQLSGQSLYDLTAKSNLTTASPKEKVALDALYTIGGWTVNLRETIYGPSFEWNSPDGGTYYKNEVKTAAITDLDVSYSFTDYLELTVGANNLFDQKPETISVVGGWPTTGNTALLDNPNPYSPYGTNGGYYYVRVSTKF